MHPVSLVYHMPGKARDLLGMRGKGLLVASITDQELEIKNTKIKKQQSNIKEEKQLSAGRKDADQMVMVVTTAVATAAAAADRKGCGCQGCGAKRRRWWC